MKTLRTVNALRNWVRSEKHANRRIGFVPTMGDFHEGHLALIQKARHENDRVAVSIFVNPIQFNEWSDYRNYRRDLRGDQNLARSAGVDLLFIPSRSDMYPKGFSTRVNERDLSRGLCGKARPGHFEGVATIVAKLFNMVQPDRAYFGEKDAQQTRVIKRMVRDLNFPVEVRTSGTVREADGLALSSRNRRLKPRERTQALRLYQALHTAKEKAQKGERLVKPLISGVRKELRGPKLRLEYVSLVDPVTLKEIKEIQGEGLLAACLWVGNTRLIDNTIIRCQALGGHPRS
jgi:pantoate--beta-alanine ligase